jgi:hypothetical protein
VAVEDTAPAVNSMTAHGGVCLAWRRRRRPAPHGLLYRQPVLAVPGAQMAAGEVIDHVMRSSALTLPACGWLSQAGLAECGKAGGRASHLVSFVDSRHLQRG